VNKKIIVALILRKVHFNLMIASDNLSMRKLYLLFLVINLTIVFFPVYAGQAQSRPQSVHMNVPFTLQAPLQEWSDPRQADGCEEASIAMAMAWARGGATVPAEEFKRDIINMSEYERVIFGFYQDTSAQDTARVLKEFYQYHDVFIKEHISSEDIKQELANNRVVIIPLNVRQTGLAIYKYGPIRHTILAVGYDDTTNEIIVHDPYYSKAQNMRIPAAALDKALWNYTSGVHKPLPARTTALISVGKSL
jgi:uncharacterized protein YvpB